MDLLGSIMSAMDKPPSLSEKERQILQKRKKEIEQKQTEEKEKLARFKDRVESKLASFFENPKNTMLKFESMDQICRSIVHEAAESNNLLSYAFGTDGVDRYVRVYRKDHPPCEDELFARRKGEPWNEQIKQNLIKSRELEKLQKDESSASSTKPKKFVPNSNYKDKYAHLIGQDAALKAAKKTETNKSYGFVPSENKKDVRSIEQTLADLRAKRQKVSHQQINESDPS